MANFMTFTPEQEKEFREWKSQRPLIIQQMIEQYPPNKLYRLKTTNQRVTLYSYHEDNTVTVLVSGKYNICSFERRVFGVPATDLEECDLPSPDEPTGTLLTNEEDIDQFLETARKLLKPN